MAKVDRGVAATWVQGLRTGLLTPTTKDSIVSLRRKRSLLARAFGTDDFGFPDLPKKMGNVAVARVAHMRDRGGCSRCFPHGFETLNSKFCKNRRSWKYHRRTRYR